MKPLRHLIAIRVVGVLATVAMLNACSLMSTSGPPTGHQQMRHFDCTDDSGTALADLGWTAFAGVTTIALADVRDDPGTSSSAAPLGIFAVLTAFAASSAIYGFVTTDACREAEAAMESRLHNADLATQQRINDLERQLATASAGPGCTADDECRADRVCEQGHCVSVPLPPAAPEQIIIMPAPTDVPAPPTAVPPSADAPAHRTGKPSYPN